jgi:hypothetical protein
MSAMLFMDCQLPAMKCGCGVVKYLSGGTKSNWVHLTLQGMCVIIWPINAIILGGFL